MTNPISAAQLAARAFAAGLRGQGAPASSAAASPVEQLAAVSAGLPANINTTRAGTGPSPQTPIVLARYVIVYGETQGVFIYEGTPAYGNPPVISLTEGTTDPYGNTVLPGIVVGTSANPQIQLQPGPNGVAYMNFPLPGTWTNYPAIYAASGGVGAGGLIRIAGPTDTSVDDQLTIQLESAESSPYSGSTGFITYLDANGGNNTVADFTYNGMTIYASSFIKAVAPGTGTSPTNPAQSESWHDLTSFSAGWSAGSPAPRVKLLAEGFFAYIEGVMSYDSTFSGNTTPCTLSGLTGYTPASNQLILGTGSSANLLLCQVSSAGDINLYGAPSGTNAVSFQGMYALD